MRSFKLLLLSVFLIALAYPQGGITQPSAGFANPMTGADQLIGSAGSSSGTPSAVSLLNCATALTYSTGTHTFGCNAAAAGVSSVSGDGTVITNSLSTGAVTLTIAGVSGGVPYFLSTSSWASSALLTANVLMKGGGAGAAPSNSSITDNGTTITTVESILISGASSQFGLNQSGGAMLTMPANTSIYSFGPNSRIVSGSIAAPSFFTSARWDGTVGSPTAVQAGDQLGGYNSFAYNGTTIAGPYGTFRCLAAETQTTIAGGTYCEIGTTANTTTTLTSRMRFENSGGVMLPSTVTGGDKGVGTLNAAGLYVNGVAVSTATSLALSSITAAVAANTIANGVNAQEWDWALTGSTAAFTFGETTAATGAGNVLLNVVMKSGSTAIAHQITVPGLGTTYKDGLYLVNTTAAANNAQQVCPNIDIGGQGWGTTGSASQAVNWRINCLPVQGAANPTVTLQFQTSVNGGAFSNSMTLSPNGALTTINGGSFSSGGGVSAASTNFIGWGGAELLMYSSSATNLSFGARSNTSYPALVYTTQANPILSVLDSNGGSTAQLAIPFIQSTTGQRYVCVTTTGILVSSAAACVGT